MKNIHKALVIIILFSSSFVFAQDSSLTNVTAGKFILTVDGFGSNDGKVMIALFNTEKGYSVTGENFKGTGLTLKDRKCEWVIEDLPFGEYAIKLYHDENGNGKMDSNMLGIPKEDYAFSNNATGNFGPAEYEDAKFIFNKDGQTHKLTID